MQFQRMNKQFQSISGRKLCTPCGKRRFTTCHRGYETDLGFCFQFAFLQVLRAPPRLVRCGQAQIQNFPGRPNVIHIGRFNGKREKRNANNVAQAG